MQSVEHIFATNQEEYSILRDVRVSAAVDGSLTGSGDVIRKLVQLRLTPANLFGTAVGGLLLSSHLRDRSKDYHETNRNFNFLEQKFGSSDLSFISTQMFIDVNSYDYCLEYLRGYLDSTQPAAPNTVVSIEDNNATGHIMQYDTTHQFPSELIASLMRNGELAKRMAVCMPGGCTFISPEMYMRYKNAPDKAQFRENNFAEIMKGHEAIRASDASLKGQYILLGDNVVQCAEISVRTLSDGGEMHVAKMTTTANHMLDGFALWTFKFPAFPSAEKLTNVRMGSFHIGSCNAPLTDRVNQMIAKSVFSHMFSMSAATAMMPIGANPVEWVRAQNSHSELLLPHHLLTMLNNVGTGRAQLWREYFGPTVAAGDHWETVPMSLETFAAEFSRKDGNIYEGTIGHEISGVRPNAAPVTVDLCSALMNAPMDNVVFRLDPQLEPKTIEKVAEVTAESIRNAKSQARMDEIKRELVDQFQSRIEPNGLFSASVHDPFTKFFSAELFTSKIYRPARADITDTLRSELPHVPKMHLQNAVRSVWSESYIRPALSFGGLTEIYLRSSLLQKQYEQQSNLAAELAAHADTMAIQEAAVKALRKQAAEEHRAEERRVLEEKIEAHTRELEKAREKRDRVEATEKDLMHYEEHRERREVEEHKATEEFHHPKHPQHINLHPVSKPKNGPSPHPMHASIVKMGGVMGSMPFAAEDVAETSHSAGASAPEYVTPAGPAMSEIFSYSSDGTHCKILTASAHVVIVPSIDYAIPTDPLIERLKNVVPLFLPSGQHIELHAINVYLCGGVTYKFYGRDVTIHAKTLTVLRKDRGLAVLDTSGVCGEKILPFLRAKSGDDGAHGKDHIDWGSSDGGRGCDGGDGYKRASEGNVGGQAGNISLFLLRFGDCLDHLKLRLTGGDGGDGQKGQDGGHGGDGGDAGRITYSNVRVSQRGRGGRGGDGGDGCDGGKGGTGGDGGNVTYYDRNNLGWDQFSSAKVDQNGGRPGKGGLKGEGGKGGVGGSGREDGKHGCAGRDGEDGKEGECGKKGKEVRTWAYTSDPEHWLMILAQVQFQYLTCLTLVDLSSKQDSGVAYVNDALDYLRSLSTIEPHFKDKAFDVIRSQLLLIDDRIAFHRDHYGNEFNYVPEMILDWEVMHRTLQQFKVIQKARDSAFTAMEDAKKNAAALNSDAGKVLAATEGNRMRMAELAQSWPKLTAEIEKNRRIVDKKRAQLLRSEMELKKLIEDRLPGCNTSSVLASIGSTLMMAPCAMGVGGVMAGPAGMIAAGGVVSIWSTVQHGMVEMGPGGQPVNQQQLLRKVKYLEKLSTTDYKQLDTGTVLCTDPDGTLLVAAQEQYEQLYESYLSQLSGNTAERIRAQFTELVDATQVLNALILTYNEGLLQYRQCQLNETLFAQAKAILTDELASISNNPKLHLLVQYFNVAYQAQLNDQLYRLYVATRIYKCLAHTPSQCMHSLSSLQSSSVLNYDTLVNTHSILEKEFYQLRVALGTKQRSSKTVLVSLTESRHSSLFEDIRDPLIRGFLHRFECVDSTDTKSTLNSRRMPEMEQFVGKADVRVHAVRVFLVGARPEEGQDVELKISHNGKFTVVKMDNSRVGYQCPAIAIPFAHDKDCNPTSRAAAIVETQVQLGNNVTAPLLSPFDGTWTVEVANFSFVDLSELKCIRFEFDINYRSFDQIIASRPHFSYKCALMGQEIRDKVSMAGSGIRFQYASQSAMLFAFFMDGFEVGRLNEWMSEIFQHGIGGRNTTTYAPEITQLSRLVYYSCSLVSFGRTPGQAFCDFMLTGSVSGGNGESKKELVRKLQRSDMIKIALLYSILPYLLQRKDKIYTQIAYLYHVLVSPEENLDLPPNGSTTELSGNPATPQIYPNSTDTQTNSNESTTPHTDGATAPPSNNEAPLDSYFMKFLRALCSSVQSISTNQNERMETIYKYAADIHRMLFLYYGSYLELPLRLMQVRMITKSPARNEASMKALSWLVGFRVTLLTYYAARVLLSEIDKQQHTNIVSTAPASGARTDTVPTAANTTTSSINSSSTPAKKCALCIDALVSPAVVPCGHIFCWSCIVPYATSRDNSGGSDDMHSGVKCPICRTEFKSQQIRALFNYT